ncbi:MAG: transcriptional repressor, partial [Nitrospinaceae bacterium]|nr:transcriptional repressor [Nitrospinaceae bacterium]
LNHLVGEGSVRAVQIPGQPARYERGDLDHHHHFHCTRCNRVFDLDGCALQTNYRVPRGFDVESHDITLSGRCPDCRRSGA